MLKDIITVQSQLISYYETTKLVIEQKQSLAETKMCFNNNKIVFKQQNEKEDPKIDSKDDNRKFQFG